ncbi:hypothetical protein BANRA_00911 [Escherichia coli]|nr:hypothetical protein BANRA_00911 [Escherichia coli]
MSEFDAQRVAERIDIVLDILVAGDYHSAIHNLEIQSRTLAPVAESTPDIPKAPWRFNNRAFRFSYLRMPGASVFLFSIITL